MEHNNEEIEAKIKENETIIEEETKAIEMYENIQKDLIVVEETINANDFIKRFDETFKRLPIIFDDIKKVSESQKLSLELQEKNLKLQNEMILRFEKMENNTNQILEKLIINDTANKSVLEQLKNNETTNKKILETLNNNDKDKVEKDIKNIKLVGGIALITIISLLSFLIYKIV